MNLQPYVIHAELLSQAILTPEQMCSMNFARDEFDKLARILCTLLDVMLLDEKNTTASDIARHLEQIRLFSGNFCWRHRHLGASHGVAGAREGVD